MTTAPAKLGRRPIFTDPVRATIDLERPMWEAIQRIAKRREGAPVSAAALVREYVGRIREVREEMRVPE